MVQESKKKRLYTWKAPGDWGRHQLDYILVKHRFRNSVKDVQTLLGADIDSDHNLLVAKVHITLKKIIRFQKSRPRWDLEKLYAQRQRVQNTLEEKLSAILFADDTSILITGQTAHKFQDDLN
jgi:hypothetical protein